MKPSKMYRTVLIATMMLILSSGDFYGLSVLLDRFPAARAIAAPDAVEAMQMSFTPTVERLARRMFPGQVAAKLVRPEGYDHDTFTLEGHELRIIEQGRTDSPDSTSLYVP
jgi:glyoxylase-like metal-dependent hydrolase (beta-lactamase superfamily II)